MDISKILRELAEQMDRARSSPSVDSATSSISPPTHPVDAEVCRVFAPYTTKRRSSYTHQFVCLAKVNQNIVPNKLEKERLAAAGLGEKKLTFFGDENSTEEFRGLLFGAYPKLRDCGGFEVLKAAGLTRTKSLVFVTCPSSGYTISCIRSQIKNGIVYIRPLQKDLCLTALEPESQPGPKEKCLNCQKEFFFNCLKDHLEQCRSSDERTSDIVDLTEEEEMENCQEPLEVWREIRHQQDAEYQQSLSADKQRDDLQREIQDKEERRKRVIHERQTRIAQTPEAGEPLRVKYPNGNIRKRRFQLTDSIQVLFDFIGEVDDATEYFHVQDASTLQTLKSNMCGTLLQNNVGGSCTLYVHWIHSDDPEFAPLDSNRPGFGSSDTNLMASTPPSDPRPSAFGSSDTNLMASTPPSDPRPSTFGSSDTNLMASTPPPAPCSPLLVPSPGHDEPLLQERIDLGTVLDGLMERVDFKTAPTSNQINICRDYAGNVHNLMKSSIKAFGRRRFNPEARLDIVFVDEDEKTEGAVDGGGPTREYLRLLMKAIQQSCIFEGPECEKRLTLDTLALEKKTYVHIGRMIAVCVVHGGVAPGFFSPRLFSQLCGTPSIRASLEEVSDVSFQEKLFKINDARTVQEAKTAIEEAEDSLAIVGAWRSISTLRQRDALVKSAIDFFVVGRLHAALQQFAEGLNTLGLLEAMKQHPDLFQKLFLQNKNPLRAADLSALFRIKYSPPGTLAREMESKTTCHWRDWLIDVEEGECEPLTLENVLEFTTGSSTVPPNGFVVQPTIEFLQPESGKLFPEANTCCIILKLPIHGDYDTFTINMCNGILWSPTFGTA